MECNGMGAIKDVCEQIQEIIEGRFGIRDVKVVAVSPTEIRLTGKTVSFYQKQMAQETARQQTERRGISGVVLDVAVHVVGY